MIVPNNKVQPTVYIIGAGLAGTMIAHEIKRKGVFGRVAAFLDDDPQKIGSKIEGIPVLRRFKTLRALSEWKREMSC